MAGYTILINESLLNFEYHENGQTAFIEYRMMDHSIVFIHTFVPDNLGGKGIAAALTVFAFDYAKQHQLPVRVYCPYIASYVKKHPELTALLDKGFDINA